jgi:DNA-binding MarR family transcriptional regulator
MNTEKTLKLARDIFTSGKMIHDNVFLIQNRELSARGRESRFGELSVAQMHLIRMIRDRTEITITELADRLGVSPPSASVMVDRLVDKGILDRKQSREDRRKVLVRISPEAVQTIERIEKAILQSFVDLVEKLGPTTARKWCEVMEKVRQALSENPVSPNPGPSRKGEKK